MTAAQLEQIKKTLLPRALKFQIGCGAEPTMYPDLASVVRLGAEAKVPYISLTTNGQLIAAGRVDLMQLAAEGLNEITLSMHGTKAETYEELMPGAKFERLQKLVDILHDVKQSYPQFKIRINFTVNSLNVYDLEGNKFWDIWDKANVQPDIIQLRPVQDFGESVWRDFDLQPLRDNYDTTIGNVIKQCKSRDITCIAPELSHLDHVADTEQVFAKIVEDITYCYVSRNAVYHDDFDAEADTFNSYHKRRGTLKQLLIGAIRPSHLKHGLRNDSGSLKLNYSVK